MIKDKLWSHTTELIHFFMRKVSPLSILLILAALFLLSCDKKDPESEKQALYALDIRDESDWDYALVADDGSSLFLNLNENTNVPTRLFFRPDKNSDWGYTVFFQENGLPEIAVIDDYILFFGNFRNTKFDMALIHPTKAIDYFYDIETPFNWEEQAGLYNSMLRSWDAHESMIFLEHGLKGVGNILGAISCHLGILAAPTGVGLIFTALGCGASMISIINDYVLPHFDASNFGVGVGATIGDFASLLGCINPSSGAVCLMGKIAAAASTAGLALEYSNSHGQEIAMANAGINGGKGDIYVTLTWNNRVDLDLLVIDPAQELIYWNHPSSFSGGRLDFDNRKAYGPENIYWPQGGAPDGTYQVYVHFYAHAADLVNNSNYTVTVNAFGNSRTFQGTVSYDQYVHITDFNRYGLIQRSSPAKSILPIPKEKKTL
jgi:hypothetical protein